MTGHSQIFLFLCGIIFFMIILFLLFKNRISERPSVLWLSGGIGILIIAGYPGILDKLAKVVGIDYPPSLLFFLSTLILLALNLFQSMEMTKLQRRITALTQHIALLQIKTREENQTVADGRDKGKEVSGDRQAL